MGYGDRQSREAPCLDEVERSSQERAFLSFGKQNKYQSKKKGDTFRKRRVTWYIWSRGYGQKKRAP